MAPRARLHVEAAGMTDCGKRHSANEDSFVVRPDLGLFVVADGFGGAPGGGLASSVAVRTIERYYNNWRKRAARPSVHETRRRLAWSFARADARVLHEAPEIPEFDRMATTLAAMAIVGSYVVLGHVGDSRIYRARAGKLERLTADHSVGEDQLFRAEYPDEPELSDPTKQRLLTELVGRGDLVPVPTRIERVLQDDVYLLCTDGLSNVLYERAIELPITDVPTFVDYVAPRTKPRTGLKAPLVVCKWYLHNVDQSGRPDDVTVIVVRFAPECRGRIRTERGDRYVVHAPSI